MFILPGAPLLLAGYSCLITAVGKEAQQSLFELGRLESGKPENV